MEQPHQKEEARSACRPSPTSGPRDRGGPCTSVLRQQVGIAEISAVILVRLRADALGDGFSAICLLLPTYRCLGKSLARPKHASRRNDR